VTGDVHSTLLGIVEKEDAYAAPRLSLSSLEIAWELLAGT
jgi:hypothetical protein